MLREVRALPCRGRAGRRIVVSSREEGVVSPGVVRPETAAIWNQELAACVSETATLRGRKAALEPTMSEDFGPFQDAAPLTRRLNQVRSVVGRTRDPAEFVPVILAHVTGLEHDAERGWWWT